MLVWEQNASVKIHPPCRKWQILPSCKRCTLSSSPTPPGACREAFRMAALNTHEHMGAVESRGCNIIVGVNRKNIIFCTFHSFKSKPQVESKARSWSRPPSCVTLCWDSGDSESTAGEQETKGSEWGGDSRLRFLRSHWKNWQHPRWENNHVADAEEFMQMEKNVAYRVTKKRV